MPKKNVEMVVLEICLSDLLVVLKVDLLLDNKQKEHIKGFYIKEARESMKRKGR